MTVASKPRGRPVGSATEDTRARVIVAARNVFAQRGYSGASMRTIAAEAGVTAMALYNYAPSKAALFELVWHASMEAFYAGFAEAVADAKSLDEEISAVFDRAHQAFLDEPAGLVFTSRLLVERDQPDLARIDLHTEPYADFFSRVTERAVMRRELARNEVGTFVAFVTTLLWGFISIATLEPASLGASVDASKTAVRRYLHNRG